MPVPRSLARINKPEFNPMEVRRAPGRCRYPANPDCVRARAVAAGCPDWTENEELDDAPNTA
jgi:hypothetical protein